jgi:hypothetical protein
MNSNGLKQDFVAQLDRLASFCNVEILISNEVEYFNIAINQSGRNNSQQNLYIYILGESEDTMFAETRLRILLDSESGLFVDSVSLPLSLIPLVGGVGFGSFKAIAKETGVNLYLPSILPEVYTTSSKHNLDVMFLSGIEAQVLLAKKLLSDVKDKIEAKLFYKSIEILKYKKDSILVNRKNELSAIMYKYGVFIQMSPLGYDDSTIHLQGCSAELIEEAINDFNGLTNEIYVADIWIFKDENGSLEPSHPIVDIDEFKRLLCKISIASNALIYADLDNSAFKLIASQDDALKAVKLFKNSSSQCFGRSRSKVRLHIELGLSYHEFVSGKKNGKISKITNGSKCTTISFLPLNEYSLLIELEAEEFDEFLASFSHLQNELPSEIKFYIPESFHRQIIGSGGSLIQSIMRKYNVFVKFSNSYDFKNNAKSLVRYDNVIIRCPYKNSSNIPLVKNELNSLLINNENITFFNTFLKVSRNQYRLLDFDKIQEIEKKTSTFIRLANVEPNDFAIVELLGTDTQSINATRLLVAELAESYEFKVTYSQNFHIVINDTNEKFVEKVKVPFKLLYNFEIMTCDTKTPESGPCHSIILSYLPNSNLYLEDAITFLTAFLREHEFMIIDRGELSNNDLIINGSASRYSTNHAFESKASAFGSSGTYPSSYPSIPTTANTTISFPGGHYQQLYQLPNHQNQNFPITQPTVVQPQVQTQFQNKKRPSTYSGNDKNHRRPY